MKTVIYCWGLALLLSLSTAQVYAQDAPIPRISISELNMAADLKGQADITFSDPSLLLSDVLQIQQWPAKLTLEALKPEQVLWIRFSIHNDTNQTQNLTLIVGNTFVDRVDGFLLDEQGRIIQSIQRNSMSQSHADIGLHGFKMDFSARNEQLLYVYLRIDDDGLATFPLELWQAEQFDAQENVRFILLGALSGGLSLLATYFFITFMLRNANTRFWFSLFAVGAMTTLLSAEGIIPSIFGFPGFAAEITALSLTGTLFAAIKISRAIFVNVSRIWLRAHYALLLLPAVSVFLYNDFWQLMALLATFIAYLVSTLLATLVYHSSMDKRSTAFYFLGWLGLACVALIEVISVISGAGHLSFTAPLPFAFACIGVMLIGVAIMSRETVHQQQEQQQQLAHIQGLNEYRDLFVHAAEGLYTAKLDGTLLHVNPALFKLFGFDSSEHLLSAFTNIRQLFCKDADADLLMGELSIQQTILGKERKGKRRDGSEFWFSISCQLSKLPNQTLHFGSLFDVTERRLDQLNLQYLNTHDQLTGLYNRRHFLQVTDERIQDTTHSHGMLFIDIDQFSVINDTCGHTAGDVYIKELSQELFDMVPSTSALARISADKFALLAQYQHKDELDQLARKVQAKVKAFEFAWDKHHFTQNSSIGLCVYEPLSMNAEELLNYADTACMVAKEAGRGCIHRYDGQQVLHPSYERELYWLEQVKRALSEDSFSLYYQHYRPLKQADERNYIEILIRLTTDDKRLIAPEFFMPVAERHHLSSKVDRWVIDTCFTWINTQGDKLANLCQININLSASTLSDEKFRYFLLNAFEKYQIPHALICFEISESSAIINKQDTRNFIDEFKHLGCSFALDNFGNGFASYRYLKNFDVDYIKIDGKFVRDILRDPIDQAMVASICDIAQAMNILTVAEAVENEDVKVQLGKMGLNFAQGFCIADPDPLSQYIAYNDLAKSNSAPTSGEP